MERQEDSEGGFISATARIITPDRLVLSSNVRISDFTVIGQRNYYDPFSNEDDKRVRLGNNVLLYPMVVVFEGATLMDDVIMEERTSVGSLTQVGARTRILYQSQVNDNVVVGEDCVIGGFVADNTTIGKRCSVFGSLIHRYRSRDPKLWAVEDEPGPIIGNDVVIGWQSVIIGPVHVGAGAFIHPNAIIKNDVPEGGIAYGS